MNYLHKIATFFSKIFEPALLIPVSFILCAVKSGLSVPQSLFWMALLTFPMLAYRAWAKKAKGLDWDMHKRESRIEPFTYLLGYLALSTIVVWIFEPVLLPILTLYSVWTVGFFIITATWTKISGHVGGDMLAIGMVIQWFGIALWPLVLIIPLVAWARVIRKDHTTLQVCLGFVYSTIIMVASSFFLMN